MLWPGSCFCLDVSCEGCVAELASLLQFSIDVSMLNMLTNTLHDTAWNIVLLVSLQVYEAVKAELKLRGGYIMSPEECKKAGSTIIKDGRLNAGVQDS